MYNVHTLKLHSMQYTELGNHLFNVQPSQTNKLYDTNTRNVRYIVEKHLNAMFFSIVGQVPTSSKIVLYDCQKYKIIVCLSFGIVFIELMTGCSTK